MKRITIIHHSYWTRIRAINNLKYETDILYDLSDKALEKKIAELNDKIGTKSEHLLWSIKRDFKLAKKADQKEYLKYCLECYYEPYTYDQASCLVAKKMIDSLREDYPDLKELNEELDT